VLGSKEDLEALGVECNLKLDATNGGSKGMGTAQGKHGDKETARRVAGGASLNSRTEVARGRDEKTITSARYPRGCTAFEQGMETLTKGRA